MKMLCLNSLCITAIGFFALSLTIFCNSAIGSDVLTHVRWEPTKYPSPVALEEYYLINGKWCLKFVYLDSIESGFIDMYFVASSRWYFEGNEDLEPNERLEIEGSEWDGVEKISTKPVNKEVEGSLPEYFAGKHFSAAPVPFHKETARIQGMFSEAIRKFVKPEQNAKKRVH